MPRLPGKPGLTVAPGTEFCAVHRYPAFPVPDNVPCRPLLASITVYWLNPPTFPFTTSVPSVTRNSPYEPKPPENVSVPVTVKVPAPTFTRSTYPLRGWSDRAVPTVPENVLSVSSKPAKSVLLVELELITAPAPEREPADSRCPLTLRMAPAPRLSRPLSGSAPLPVAFTIACDTVVEPGQLVAPSSTAVAFAIVLCASKPESVSEPLPRTGTWRTTLPRAPRVNPAPRRTSALRGCVPGWRVTVEEVETVSVEIVRAPSRAMAPPAPMTTSAVPSSGGTAPPAQFPASSQRPVPAAP